MDDAWSTLGSRIAASETIAPIRKYRGFSFDIGLLLSEAFR